jgi:penicillin amidase
MRPEDRRAFAAYARGVNHYLATHLDRLPIDFVLLGFQPRPWRVTDSILAGLNVSNTLSRSWELDVQKQNLLQSGDWEKVEALFPVRTGLESSPGSNAWVLAGSRTVSGKPLLANDPHLAFSVPSFWHQVHIQTPGMDVVGVAVPGLPGVTLGHNQHIAWGATNLHFDVQDLYLERFDATAGRYLHRGRLFQAVRRREVIRVKDEKPVVLDCLATRHGPVVVAQANLQLALRWTALDPGAFRYPFLAINRATNWPEFRAALAEYVAPPQNFVYADTAGNIGYQAAGRLPLREYDSSVPVDGASGEFEWSGTIPFEDLPSVFNPDSGVLVTANENPFPAEYEHPARGEFAPGYRGRRIRELLNSRPKWDAKGIAEIQMDIQDAFLRGLAGQVVAAYRDRGVEVADLTAAAGILERWDGEMDHREAAPLIASLLFQHLRRAVSDLAAPGAGRSYDPRASAAVVERLLSERPENWHQDFDQLLLRSLIDALEEGKRMQGDDIEAWQYGRGHELRLSPGVIERLPVLGKRFRFDSMPLSGSTYTVRQTSPILGPSLRTILDPGDWTASQAVLPLGVSGHATSSHFRDQWDEYWAGGNFPVYYQQFKPYDRLEFTPAQ